MVGSVGDVPTAAGRGVRLGLPGGADLNPMAVSRWSGLEGVAERAAKGRAEGVAGALTRLLVKSFGPLTSERPASIDAASIDEVLR